MDIQLPEIENIDAIPKVISGFAAAVDFIRKLYFLIYNAVALLMNNPTKRV